MKSRSTLKTSPEEAGPAPARKRRMLLDETEDWEVDPKSVERFWSKVSKTESCWVISGFVTEDGHVTSSIRTKFGKSNVGSHRLSWFLHNGPIPFGMIVCHRCPGGDNPACVNPSHLYVGTDATNVNDTETRGNARHPSGEDHGRALLTKDQVIEIKESLLRGEMNPSQVLQKYPIGRSALWHLMRGRNWKGVGPDITAVKFSRTRTKNGQFSPYPELQPA